ncbi:MAG: carboxypeptidase regulatory-like domain-containing protein [Planctomycetes bacterium]|nr:carboxypeptidase regulatory-like domain-containing protein [Planctomycetota bacterium]
MKHQEDESISAPGGTGSKPDRLAPEAEFAAQGRLIELLTSLEEPLRSTLVRHYHHGLTWAEIARADNVPEATVRARLRRARDLLHERFDAPKRSRSFAWLPFLAFDPPHGTEPVALAARLLPWVLWTMGVGVLVVLIAAPFGLWGASRSPVSATELELAARDRVAAGVPEGSRPAAERQPALSESRTERPNVVAPNSTALPTRPGEVRAYLRALDEAGRPVADAVVARVDLIGGQRVANSPAAEAGADGRIELVVELTNDDERLSTERSRSVALRIEAPGRAGRDLWFFAVSGDRIELGDVILPRAGWLTGRVLETNGTPCVDVEVRLTLPDLDAEEQMRWPDIVPALHDVLASTQTDAEGRFRFERVEPGALRAWALVADRCGRASRTVLVRPDVETRVEDLVVQPYRHLHRGLVVDHLGEPVARARIDQRHDGVWSLVGFTDAKGEFRIELDRSGHDDLHVWSPSGNAGALFSLGVESSVEVRRYALPPARSARFHVRDAEGRAIAGARWTQSYNDRLDVRGGRADEDGSFTLFLPATSFKVEVVAPGYEVSKWTCADPVRLEPEVDVVLAKAAELRGRVLAADGAPADGVEVRLLKSLAEGKLHRTSRFPQRFEEFTQREVAKTDAEGAFAITLRQREPITLAVYRGDVIVHHAGTFEAGHGLEPIELRLSVTGAIEGRIQLPAGVHPTGRWVGVSFGDERVVPHCVGEDGRFRFEALAPGRWWIHRLVEDAIGRPTRAPLAPAPQFVDVLSGETAWVEIDLRDEITARLRGRFALAGVDTWAWTAAFLPNEREPFTRAPAHPFEAAGTFELPDLEPCRGLLILRDGGDADVCREVRLPMDLEHGTRQLDVVLDAARVELTGWRAEHGLALVRRLARGGTVVTRVVASALDRPLEVVVPAGRVELHALDDQGAWTEPLLGEIELAVDGRGTLAP